MIYRIESKQNSKIKQLLDLDNNSSREKEKEFIVEGFHMLEMALESNMVKRIFSIEKIENIPDKIPQYLVNEEIMKKISHEKTPQGVVAVCKYLEEKQIKNDHILYLDGVSDPGNVGTLFRTALAFGYKTVILTKNSCSIYNPKTLQSSQGAIFILNIVIDNNELLNDLKNKGFQIIVTDLNSSIKIDEIKPRIKHVLVLGNEAHGVSEKSLQIADKKIRIEISDIESLNVGVAGGISMFYLSKK